MCLIAALGWKCCGPHSAVWVSWIKCRTSKLFLRCGSQQRECGIIVQIFLTENSTRSNPLALGVIPKFFHLPDPAHTCPLEKCLSVISTPICQLINMLLDAGYVCIALKTATVTPILKKSDLDSAVLEIRETISNLPLLDKVVVP